MMRDGTMISVLMMCDGALSWCDFRNDGNWSLRTGVRYSQKLLAFAERGAPDHLPGLKNHSQGKCVVANDPSSVEIIQLAISEYIRHGTSLLLFTGENRAESDGWPATLLPLAGHDRLP